MSSVLEIEVSCFAAYDKPNNPRPVILLSWLTSAKYQTRVEAIQAINDKKERDTLKATLPAITPSGLFSRRASTALLRHSYLICLDIDFKQNSSIANYADLKPQICHLSSVAYCGLSVSGTGYFVLILIAYPHQHEAQFRALQIIFKKKFGIVVDDTPDVARLRGYSYDPDGYFNHQPQPFKGVYTPPVIKPIHQPHITYIHDKDSLISRCVRLIEEAADGEKHVALNKAAFTAGGFIAGQHLEEQTAITALEEAISQKPNIADFKAAQRTIRVAIERGKQRPIYAEPLVTPIQDRLPRPQVQTRQNVVEQFATLDGEEWPVEICPYGYPASWDEPNPPRAMPTIKAVSVAEFFNANSVEA